MTQASPQATVARFVAALQRSDLDAAVTCYEADALFVPQPGVVVRGHAAIREALTQLLAAQPRLLTQSEQVLACGDVALYHSRWQLHGRAPDGSTFSEQALSADVLRCAPDGAWRIAVDNPWGAALLDTAAGAPA